MRIRLTGIATFIFLSISASLFAQSYDKLWKDVSIAQKKDLPKSIVTTCNTIIKKAQSEKNSGQMLKAFLCRMEYKTAISPDSFYVQLKDLEKISAETPKPIDRMIIHSILAEMYTDYISGNQWNLNRRTDVANKKGTDEKAPDDIREWTRIQFYDTIMKHIDASLADIKLLHKTSTKDYVPFTILQWASEYYRHDLLHLLGNKDINTLRQYLLSSSDNKNTVHQRIDDIYRMMQNLYQSENEENAFILVTLDRLKEQYNLTNNRDAYLSELNKLQERSNTSNPVCAEIYLAKANCAYEKREMNKALILCNEGIDRFPKYDRINALRDLKNMILNPTIELNMNDFAYPKSKINLGINHKNSDGFTLLIYKVLGENIPEKLNSKACQLISSPHFQLTRPKDYLEKSDSFQIATPEPGIYLIKIKPDNTNGNTDNRPQVFRVSRLKLLTIKLEPNKYEVVVVDGITGQPVNSANVLAYNYQKKLLQQVVTDTQGKATLLLKDNNIRIKATKDDDKYMDLQYLYGNDSYYYGDGSKSTDQVCLLTDRSIYRPGQTVCLKGIAYSQQKDSAQVVMNRTFTLSLRDVNQQEIANKKVTTNDFGSFATDFSLPSTCLNGEFSISADSQWNTSFRVEEYKRPTFDVKTDEIKETYSLNDTVTIKGTAKSFSGVPLEGAMIKYTIKRVKWLWWSSENDKIIAADSTKVGADGRFTFPISLNKDNEKTVETDQNEYPILKDKDDINTYYTFIADINVTNQAGETQSDEVTLAVGNRSLILNLSSNKLICKDNPIAITLEAKNLLQKQVKTTIGYSLSLLKENKEVTVVDKGSAPSNKELTMSNWQDLTSGAYLLRLSAKDTQGRNIEKAEKIVLFSTTDTQPADSCDLWYYGVNTHFDAKHSAKFYFGTSRRNASILMNIFCKGKRIESKMLNISNQINCYEYPYKEAYDNGIAINFCFVKDETMFQKEVVLEKIIPDNELKMKWSVFRDKLRPGQKEEWRLSILTPDNKPANAEMLAYMYDTSLYKLWKRNQNLKLSFNRYIFSNNWNSDQIGSISIPYWSALPNLQTKPLTYDDFFKEFNFQNINYKYNKRIMVRGIASSMLYEKSASPKMTGRVNNVMLDEVAVQTVSALSKSSEKEESENNIFETQPKLRTNFAETAFFYPQLRTDNKGNVSILFTLPESLTSWSFNGYAHTKDMMTGSLTGEVTASKDFMLTPNLPRFVRVGDRTYVAATVSNLSNKAVNGSVKFELFDPMTNKVIQTQSKPLSLVTGKSVTTQFDFTVTDRYDVLGCRLIAEGGTFSDGEQHLIAVLSDKIMLTESVPLPIRGNQVREFSLDKLFNNHSTTATHRKLTLEYTSNPLWYAIQALPSLALPDNDNAISWATVLYANSLASYIMNSTPRIKAVFDSWKLKGESKETLLSNLQKNQELKNILLEESPWVLEAKSEQEQKERLGTLFDLNNIQNYRRTAISKLQQLQDSEGAWCWFKGMSGSRYVTEYVLRLNARLKMLTGESYPAEISRMQSAGFKFLHSESLKEYKLILKAGKEGQKIRGISHSALRYLYLIAISDEKVPLQYMNAYNYFLSKVNEEPTSQNMQEKALAAIILYKVGKEKAAEEYIASIKEHLTKSDELGMYFDFNESPYNWYGQHLTAHVAAIEAIDKVTDDSKTVEEMKMWLLKQKQTQQWNSPVMTTDAVFALLNKGMNLSSNQGNVHITLAGKEILTQQPDESGITGLGYIKQSFDNNVTVDARTVKVEKRDAGIAWGAVYAQFQEQISQIKQQGNSAFSVEKELYVKNVVNNVEQLQPFTSGSELKVGDIIVARLVIKLDRDMDFVQLKEQRGACFEPINALSGYHWGAGISYYEEFKDASTNFFFDFLNKGLYVLEINYRVSRAGNYEAGLSILQCAYAPEYATHSDSMRIVIKP